LIKRFAAICALILLGACTTHPNKGGYYQDDGPHNVPEKDIGTIANAVPRAEPLSEKGNKPYAVFGKTYHPLKNTDGYQERGVASWYGKKFHGNSTSSGEPYDMYAMTAAHKTLPLPSYVEVKNLQNGRSVIVRVNDRGPFLHNRLIDLSYAAASKLGIVATGTGLVEVSAIATTESVIEAEALPPSQRYDSVTENVKIYLQVGAFNQKQNAEGLKTRLAKNNIGPVFIQDKSSSNNPIYRVRIGPLDSVAHSDDLVEKVRLQGIWDAHIIIE